MKHIFNNKKKFILPVIILATLLPINAQKAHAFGVMVPVLAPVSDGIASLHTGFQDVAKMGLDTLAYVAAQAALDMMTQNTVNWIKGGFNGSPAFATDPAKFFLDTANMVSGGLSNQIRGINTCNFNSNFNNILANSVALSTRSGANAKFNEALRCPFPTGTNAQSFYQDFGNGGWRAYQTALSDSGNPFGTALIASQELSTRQAEAQDIQKQELGWAGGFLSMKQCTGTDPDTGLQTGCVTTTPGKIIGDQLNTALGTDSARLNLADNMNKIFAALIGQLTRSATTGIFR